MFGKNEMEMLLKGKKIRSKRWSDGLYFYLDDDGILRDEDNKIVECYLDLKADYEEYVKYDDYYAAMKHMVSGRKVRRAYGDYAIFCNNNGMIILDDEFETPYQLMKDDIKANDWILL